MQRRNIFRNNIKGVTLVEIMMVAAVMGVLFLGLFSLIPAPLCENVSRLTSTNLNQESFAVELILEKSDAGGNKKEYKMNSKFTPAVP